MFTRSIGAASPIGPVLVYHVYIGPVLVIPARLFRGRDHLFTILPQHFLYHVPTAPATLLAHIFEGEQRPGSPGSPRNGSGSAEDDDADVDQRVLRQ